jgi:murein DD-endopeptidase MepM/ murein hydrolase activator NlpD
MNRLINLIFSIVIFGIAVPFGIGNVQASSNFASGLETQRLTIDPSIQSATGFYWPTDLGDPKNELNWLASGCSWTTPKKYEPGYYHIGMDIVGAERDKVYAISDGKVLRISRNNLNDPKTKARVDKGEDPAGWGIGNVAVIVDHQLIDGSHFIAVYGHIKDDPKNKILTGETTTIFAHDLLGLMGPYPKSKPHLHLGIFPVIPGGLSAPSGNLGRLTCPKTWPITNMNGFTSPYLWLTTKTPKNQMINIITPTPTLPIVPLDYVRVGAWQLGKTFMLTYGVNEWAPKDNSKNPGRPYQLESKKITGCVIRQNDLDKAPESWKISTSQENIGGVDFFVDTWTAKSTGKTVLVIFRDKNGMEIAVNAIGDYATCLDASRLVIRYSAANSFGPIKR